MKKFLFLDDSQERHDRFAALCRPLGVEVCHVKTVTDAIRAVSTTKFDTVWLDHDLEDSDPIIVQGLYDDSSVAVVMPVRI